MLSEIKVKGFTGLPYLEQTQLMRHHKGRIRFSQDRASVIVGPNGAGKSALLTALALRFLAYFEGVSTFDGQYVLSSESEAWWTNASKWGHDYSYLQGLDCDTDSAPALYYRPGHIPGNEGCIATSMMTGYFEQAKAYARKVENRSSGQGNAAMLERIMNAMRGEALPLQFRGGWRFGGSPRDLSGSRGYVGPYDHKAEVLKKLMVPDNHARPLLLLDEPEQSLDARAELQFWKAVEEAKLEQVQVVIATHSVYPLRHSDRFHIIEAEEGFAAEVVALLET